MAKQPPLIVVGCPRSGTSVFAKLLSAAGLRSVVDERMGEKYPSGYYEYPPLIMFHKAMERYPRSTPNRTDQAITREEFLKVEYLNEPFVRLMFERAFEPLLDHSVDFIKYPQLALSPEFLLETFPDAHVIALWRNPEVTIHSLARAEITWDLIPFRGARAVLLWGMYAYHICRAKELYPDRVTVLSSDALVKSNVPVGPFLHSLGYDLTDATAADVSQPGLWSTSVGFGQKLYVRSLWRALQAANVRTEPDTRDFANFPMWHKRLEQATDMLPFGVDQSMGT